MISCLFGFLASLSIVQSRMINSDRRVLYDVQKDTYCSNPVEKQEVSFPSDLAGQAKITFEMYSGYVAVTSAPDYLFYWFFSSQDGNQKAPLIIWTNG